MKILIGVLAVALAGAAQAGDAAAGKKVAGMCRTCHGLDGIAVLPEAPNLAGENPLYLVGQLKAFRAGTRKHEVMSVVAAGLSETQIADVAAWYGAIRISVTLPE